ncbi:MAG: 5-nucleotidase [Nitrobacter vulgaris]|nr:5-nucleotidase [Nitrobacter vulgaris]
MRILCTNDDGIHAPGLEIIEQIAKELSDDVWVVAPEHDQSGVSHSLTLNDPLRLRELGPRHFAVKGTPTDCVIMGSRHILGDKGPDLVLSGVNRGRNLAEDVVYSGTIAGALEGTMLGLPSFALSQEFSLETGDKPVWETARTFAPQILRKVIDIGIPKNTVVNVNFPACAPEEVAGVLVTRMGKRNLGFLKIHERRDGRGNPYFWIGFEKADAVDTPASGTDLAAIAAQCVSVAIFRRKPLRAIARCENEGPVAARDDLGHRGNQLSVDVDVENRDVEVCGMRELESLLDVARFGGDAITEFLQHIRNHHADHNLVFDEEYRAAGRPCRCHGRNPDLSPTQGRKLCERTQSVPLSRPGRPAGAVAPAVSAGTNTCLAGLTRRVICADCVNLSW